MEMGVEKRKSVCGKGVKRGVEIDVERPRNGVQKRLVNGCGNEGEQSMEMDVDMVAETDVRKNVEMGVKRT